MKVLSFLLSFFAIFKILRLERANFWGLSFCAHWHFWVADLFSSQSGSSEEKRKSKEFTTVLSGVS